MNYTSKSNMEEYTQKLVTALKGLFFARTTDKTLTIEGEPADAKATGDAIQAIAAQGGGMSSEAKAALLALLAKVAYIDDDGQDLYDALESALTRGNLLSITAEFTQGQAVIYDTDSLDSLRQYLVVTAHYDDSTSEAVTTYTLSGTLTAGTSTITVFYDGKTTTFTVTVTSRTLYSLENRAFNGEVIDTELALFSEDRDWSICIDATITANPTSGTGSKWRLCYIQSQDESTYYLAYGKGNATAAITVARYMTPYQSFLTPSLDRKHIVLTHAKDSGIMMCYGYEGEGTRKTVTVSGATFTATNKHLLLGGETADLYLPTGEFHTFKVLDCVLSADEITAFLGK